MRECASHEYAFDVLLTAVARVRAETEQAARQALLKVLDTASLTVVLYHGRHAVRLTEASITLEDLRDPTLFEVDGVIIEPQ